MKTEKLNINNLNVYLGSLAHKIYVPSIAFGILLLCVTVFLGFLGEWSDFFKSWLFGFMVVSGTSLGALIFVMLQFIVKAGWSVVVRRLAEGMASNLRWVWILFVPILVLVLTGKGDLLYGWCDLEKMSNDYVLSKKSAYLSSGFWSIRAVFYLASWAFLSHWYFKKSIYQDVSGNPKITLLLQKYAPLGIVLYALTQSFAAIDWAMSLQPKWFSTMFGVYWFASCFTGFLAMITIVVYLLNKTNRLLCVSKEHFHDLGKLLFAFGAVFWAYIGFSQYLLIWYANIPIETEWFIVRQMHPWLWVTLLLLFGHFVFPFLCLISRWPKRWVFPLAIAGVWMFIMFILDAYWLIYPRVPEEIIAYAGSYADLANEIKNGNADVGFGFKLIQLTAVLGMIFIWVGATAWTLRNISLIPVKDPRLEESIAFENF